MDNYYFIRTSGEVGWVYILSRINGQTAFVNEFIPGDYILYINGHYVMHPITEDQYVLISEVLIQGGDPTELIQRVLRTFS